MPTGSSGWRHTSCGCRLGRRGCPCNIWWVWVEQWPNYLTLWPTGPVLRITSVQYIIEICIRQDIASDAISGRFVEPAVPDNRVKFGDPRLNLSLSRNSTWSRMRRHFRRFFHCSFRPEAVSDIISSVVVDPTRLKVPIKFGDSRSNHSRDIGLHHFERQRRRRPTDPMTKMFLPMQCTVQLCCVDDVFDNRSYEIN